jgi:hypothetical protein
MKPSTMLTQWLILCYIASCYKIAEQADAVAYELAYLAMAILRCHNIFSTDMFPTITLKYNWTNSLRIIRQASHAGQILKQ